MSNILTEKIKIKHISDPDFIKDKVKNYTYAFHLVYKHYDKIKDKEFLNNIKTRFNLNEHELRSLIIDVESFFKSNKKIKENKEKEILSIINEIKNTKNIILKEGKSNKLTRKLFKLNKKLKIKEKHLSDDIVFGSRFLLQKISYLSNDKTKNKKDLDSKLKEYRKKRELGFYIVGDSDRNGNRHYDLSKLSENKIILKYKNIKVEIELNKYHNKSIILNKLQLTATNCELPITITLSNEYIFITYDLEKLNNSNINEKERKIECKKIKDSYLYSDEEKTLLIKEVYKKYYKEREERIIFNGNKMSNRVASVDLNPENIGFSILEYDKKYKNGFKIIHVSNYDLSGLNEKLGLDSSDKKQVNQNNKRKYEIIQVWKQIFRICNHYKCSFFIHEELNFKPKVLKDSSTEGNKKIHNLWHRTITEKIIQKYCTSYGLIEREVNSCYTSFIGNLSYNYIDAANAAIEIGRRHFYKEIEQEFYPIFDIGTIMNTMQSLNSDGDVSFLKDCEESWIMCYKHINSLNAGLKPKHKFRWRRSLMDALHPHNELSVITRKTKVKKNIFS